MLSVPTGARLDIGGNRPAVPSPSVLGFLAGGGGPINDAVGGSASVVATRKIIGDYVYEYDRNGNLIRKYPTPSGAEQGGAQSYNVGQQQRAASTYSSPTSGGGGGGGGSGGAFPADVTNPSNLNNQVNADAAAVAAELADQKNRTGTLSKNINSTMLDTAWGDPEAVLRLYSKLNGMVGPGGAEAELQDMANSLGILWMIAQDQKGGAVENEARDFFNWLGPSLDSWLGSSGGTLIDRSSDVLNTLLNPKDALLKDYLGVSGEGTTSMTRQDSVDNYLSAAQYALKPGTPTPVLNAILNAISGAGRGYRAAQLQNPKSNQSFNQYLKAGNVVTGLL